MAERTAHENWRERDRRATEAFWKLITGEIESAEFVAVLRAVNPSSVGRSDRAERDVSR